ncbi:uncharacterized protein LOC108678155 [Hyalella azteca]|uniref:Hexosyltransferase n=1 Tax=Hyalella azteca TaxID=294128 RepID=A0A8B7P7G7_HYAAZ|nr:uncharacterized protein LOC108678155 [Hyalella azteca]XP_047741030.1 uncharacterized protein LOC108678155 [Hyalella azteca]
MVLVVRAGRVVVRSWQRLAIVVIITTAACSLIFINRCKLATNSYAEPLFSELDDPSSALSARAPLRPQHRPRSLAINLPPSHDELRIIRDTLHPFPDSSFLFRDAPHQLRDAPHSIRDAHHQFRDSSHPLRDATFTARDTSQALDAEPLLLHEASYLAKQTFPSIRKVSNHPHPEGSSIIPEAPNSAAEISHSKLYAANKPHVRLGVATDIDGSRASPAPFGRVSLGHDVQAALSEDEEQRAAYIRHLLLQIASLQQEVAALRTARTRSGAATNTPLSTAARTTPNLIQREPLRSFPASKDPASEDQSGHTVRRHGSSFSASSFPSDGHHNASQGVPMSAEAACSATLQQQILQSEVVRGLPLNNEYEVVPFSHFSWSRVYPSELGLGKRVVEKPIGYRRKDVLAALTAALDHLNAYQNHGYRYSMDDFVEGSFRTIPTAGTQYELVFRDSFRNNENKNNNSSIMKNSYDGRVLSKSSEAVEEVNSRATRKEGSEKSGIISNPTKSIVKSHKNTEKTSSSFYNITNNSRKIKADHNLTKLEADFTGSNKVNNISATSSVQGNLGESDNRSRRKLIPDVNISKNISSSGKSSRSPSSGNALKIVTLVRPFAPITVVKSRTNTARQLINIILPLSGRLQTFQRFMTKLTTVILPHDRRIFLTVVYFGDDGLQRARNIITKASRDASFRMVKLLTLNETFSRGKALQVGAQHWSGGDVLLFMCDVDVVFSTRFLDRCRMNAEPGRSVYYPVIFSLYNPGLVYPIQGKPIPEDLDQLVISRDTGFWRDFGYGMTCQYRSDFLSVNGFDQEIVGWGGEDVLLYRKYVRSSLAVVRSTDPGIFHLWHPKLCSSALPGDQYRACLSSRALSEASHAHLGLVAFKKDLEKHPVGSQILPGISAAEKNLNTAAAGGSYQATGEI